nr:ATPase, T2SS/T4P/T4SS family [Candidatus Hamiltonella defensa]
MCNIEDPVAIPIKKINQTQSNYKIGLDFFLFDAHDLRQDPDIIMVGKIRDNNAAAISLKAAHTGHFVLSTLHTNSTTETLTCLTQMNIPGYLLASCLKLIFCSKINA